MSECIFFLQKKQKKKLYLQNNSKFHIFLKTPSFFISKKKKKNKHFQVTLCILQMKKVNMKKFNKKI
jgi:hypothetical protein